LRRAAEQGKIRDLPGFGEKIERNILADLKEKEPVSNRFRIDRAEKMIRPLLDHLRQSGKIETLEVAGSYRRRKETVGDIDILAISPDGREVIDHFTRYAGVREVMMQGETRSTVILGSGLQVDLRVVPRKNYGAALLYFTGSKPHNLHLRMMAIERGWKNNEYGLFNGDKTVACETEEDMYRALGLPWIPPELREDNGEIEAARANRLPRLITQADIRGDLHAHTTASDGHASLETMANSARRNGYAYLAITDHSRSLRIARGQSVEALARQMDEIDQLNERWTDFRLLKSCEVDILEDGTLDMPDDILSRLDLRVCSIHSHFKLSREKQTERILRAMENPYFNIFAHPTGRLLEKRSGYEIALEQVMAAAKQRGCFMEINAQPERLDLNDAAIRLARENDIKLAISTDAHTPEELDFMYYGVDQARRGWLEPADILNSRDWPDLKKQIKR
jgi:DNA polymerase (family 10)